MFLTASVGVAVSEHGRETAEELLRDADAAMYRAKELGGGRFEAFDVALRHHLVERMAIEGDLRHAVERDQLELHYQPLIDLADERIVGFEALLRWRHPERGLIAPDQFIPIAEETGLIVPIGSWVLRTVCAQLAQLARGDPRVGQPLRAADQPRARGRSRAAARPAPASRPTGSCSRSPRASCSTPAIKPVVASLRALGVQLALDDFGTGYSSLGSLQRFPLDLVKLDRTLIASIAESRGVAVVRAAVELGQALGVHVIAEGIEAPDTARRAARARLPARTGLPVRQATPTRRGPTPTAHIEPQHPAVSPTGGVDASRETTPKSNPQPPGAAQGDARTTSNLDPRSGRLVEV